MEGKPGTSPEEQSSPRNWRDHLVGFAAGLGGKALTVVVGLVVTAIALTVWGILSGSSKSTAEELDTIRHDAAAQGLFAVIDRSIELRGDGSRSRLLVFRKQEDNAEPESKTSDRIEIYDEVGHHLKKTFAFQPSASEESKLGYRFTLAGVGDFQATDRSEIAGSYSTEFMNAAVPRPVVIDWDESEDKYRISALLARPLGLSRRASPGFYGEVALRLYQPRTLRDSSDRLVVSHAYGTETFTILTAEQPAQPLLLAAFVVSAESHAAQPLIQLRAWQLNFEAPVPQAATCVPLNEHAILFRPRSFNDLAPAALKQRWTDETKNGIDCG